MADLTEEEAVKARMYLGYTRYDSSLDAPLKGLSAAAYAQVQEILDALDALDARMGSAVDMAGTYRRVEDVEWRGPEGQHMLASRGAALVRRLAALLGVPVRQSPFPQAVTCGPMLRG